MTKKTSDTPATSPLSAKTMLVRWSTFHAVLMLIGTVISFLVHNTSVVAWAVILSFSALILIFRKNWTPGTWFGRANSATLIRLLAVQWIAFRGGDSDNFFIAILSFIVLAGDGIDGWLAHKFKEESEFGEYFDKETDAYFILVLCLTAIQKNLFDFWIIFIGLLRYLFVVFIYFYRGEVTQERRSKIGRYIFVIVVISIIIVFLPVPILHLPVIIFSTVLLLYSFGRDVLWILFKN